MGPEPTSLVVLRAVEERDLEAIRAFRADPSLREEIMAAPEPETAEQHRAWFEGLAERRDCEVFAIADARSDEVVGTCGLFHIEPAHGTAEWGFFIGSEPHKNDGSAVDAELQLLDHAFNDRQLRRVWCRVVGRNERVVSLHQRFGFQIEGTLRRHRAVRDGHDDVVLMGLFADEYQRSRDAIAQLVATMAQRRHES